MEETMKPDGNKFFVFFYIRHPKRIRQGKALIEVRG